MLQEAEFWVALSTVIFAVLAFGRLRAAIVGMVDERAAKIRRELEEAQRLREEAQTLLASYQRRQREALKEAEAILAHAREEAARLRQHAGEDLEASLKRREAQALDKIAQAEAAALKEVRDLTVDVAISASRQVLTQRVDDARSARMVEDAIATLPRHLN